MRGLPKLGVGLLALSFAGAAGAENNVRIVDFTLVTGGVEVQMPGEQQWHPALLNAPVVAGEHVRTLVSGRAEIQLEHGSTLRLIPQSELVFPRLSASDSGGFQTTAQVVSGTAFVTLRRGDDHDFQLALPGDANVMLAGTGSLRADASSVVVLDGKATVQMGRDQVTLDKQQQTTLARPLRATAANPTDPWTDWSRTRDQFYEAAFHHGVQPGSLSTYVNWGENATPMPTYTGTGLAYSGSASCPWTVNSGDFKGWCWSGEQGWYLPAETVSANDASASTNANANVAELDQTNGQLQTIAAPPFDPGLAGGGMYWNVGCGFDFVGVPGSAVLGCPTLGLGLGLPEFWAANTYPIVYLVPSGGAGAQTGSGLRRNPRMPGERFRPGVQHSTTSQLHPPPQVAARAVRPGLGSGIQPAHLGFHPAANFGAREAFSSMPSGLGAASRTTAASNSFAAGMSRPSGNFGGVSRGSGGGSAGVAAHGSSGGSSGSAAAHVAH